MSSRSRKALKFIALFLIFSVSQVYVQADFGNRRVNETGAASDTASGKPIFGKLTTIKNQPINVNGNSVSSGTSIRSGTQLQTPDGVGATISLRPMGKLDIAPKTELVLVFDKGNIEVTLIAGCIILTTHEGITGAVKTPQGVTERTDPAKLSSIDVCTGDQGAASPLIGEGAAAKAGAGVLWETVERGNLLGTICDCSEIIAGGGFPKWPLVALGGVALLFKDNTNTKDGTKTEDQRIAISSSTP